MLHISKDLIKSYGGYSKRIDYALYYLSPNLISVSRSLEDYLIKHKSLWLCSV